MKGSIFDRFASKETGEQPRKLFRPAPEERILSGLNTAGGEAKARYPDDKNTVDNFARDLKEVCKIRYKGMRGDKQQPMKAAAQFFLSEDRMRAYACLFPPENGGEDLGLEEFLANMRYEGIQFGILHEEIQREYELGYLRIFQVARGRQPQAGEEGKVTELFQRNGSRCLETRDGAPVDFKWDIPLQPIRKGTAICLLRPSRPGTDGMDVTGQVIPSPHIAEILVPQGKNTIVDRNGQVLAAGADGILYIENDQFCVLEQKVIDGDLNQFQGTLRVSGNLYIGGSVDGGVEIEATGQIVINGKVGQARITSTGGTIRVQQGIFGTEGKTFLTADGQIQSPVVEWADLNAGTNVVADMITSSVVNCGGTAYVTTGHGVIADSLVRAGESILCQRAGRLSGGNNQFSVGYPPHISASWRRIRTELAEIKPTIEKLWDAITSLRRKGNRISEGEKLLLEQLVEQRSLYIERRETLTAELANVSKLLDKKNKGMIHCELLYPVLDVQIGRFTEVITSAEKECSIHAGEGRIFLK